MDDGGRDIAPDEDRLNYQPPPHATSNGHHEILSNEDLQEDWGVVGRGHRTYQLQEPEDTTSDAVGSIEHTVFHSHSRRPQVFNGTEYYMFEENRLATFQDWRHQSIIRKEDLARNGFIYTGTSDRVRCIFCNVVLRQWEQGDVVEEEHQRNFPLCPFVCGENVGNVPYSPLTNGYHTPSVVTASAFNSRIQVQRPKGYDIDPIEDRCGAASRPPVHATSYHISDAVSGHNNGTGDEDPYQGSYSNTPRNPNMAIEPDRLATFDAWPAQMKQKPKQLAQAGLYYVGDGDKTKCFHCDVTLYNWDPEDDPFVEHARWSPECQYIHLVKGDKFVSDAQKGQGTIELEMQTPAVLAVLYEGHSMDTVQKALRLMKEREGADTVVSAAKLLEFVLELEGNAESKAPVVVESANGIPEPGDVEKLRLENESLKDKQLCKICMDNDVEVVFYPCKHFVCCASCSAALRECPICRVAIQGMDKVFMS